jgi:hypothetical protein
MGRMGLHGVAIFFSLGAAPHFHPFPHHKSRTLLTPGLMPGNGSPRGPENKPGHPSEPLAAPNGLRGATVFILDRGSTLDILFHGFFVSVAVTYTGNVQNREEEKRMRKGREHNMETTARLYPSTTRDCNDDGRHRFCNGP